MARKPRGIPGDWIAGANIARPLAWRGAKPGFDRNVAVWYAPSPPRLRPGASRSKSTRTASHARQPADPSGSLRTDSGWLAAFQHALLAPFCLWTAGRCSGGLPCRHRTERMADRAAVYLD